MSPRPAVVWPRDNAEGGLFVVIGFRYRKSISHILEWGKPQLYVFENYAKMSKLHARQIFTQSGMRVSIPPGQERISACVC